MHCLTTDLVKSNWMSSKERLIYTTYRAQTTVSKKKSQANHFETVTKITLLASAKGKVT